MVRGALHSELLLLLLTSVIWVATVFAATDPASDVTDDCLECIAIIDGFKRLREFEDCWDGENYDCRNTRPGCMELGKDDTGSRGVRFATAVPPVNYSGYAQMRPVDAELIFNARDTTTVTLTSPDGSESFVVPAMTATSRFVRAELRVTNGVELKAITVTSDLPVTVHMASDHQGHAIIADSTILRPLRGSSCCSTMTEYKYPLATVYGCPISASKVNMFYMVVGTTSPTNVSVYIPRDDAFILHTEFELKANEVFTFDAGGGDLDYDFLTGGYVLSNKPVAVYSGNGCTGLPASDKAGAPSYIMDAMPLFADMGKEYITFQNVEAPLGHEWGEGYYVQVVSYADVTEVNIMAEELEGEDADFVLDAGESRKVLIDSSKRAARVNCSVDCLVVEYGAYSHENSRPYMIALTPTKLLSTDLLFTTPNRSSYPDVKTVLALTLKGSDETVTDLYLNNTSLSFLPWQAVAQSGYLAATMLVDPGTYVLHSMYHNHTFAAYLYTWLIDTDYYDTPYNSGFAVGYGGDCVRSYLNKHNCVQTWYEPWQCGTFARVYIGGPETCRCCDIDAYYFGQEVKACYRCELPTPSCSDVQPPPIQQCLPAVTAGWGGRRRRAVEGAVPATADEACTLMDEAVKSQPYTDEGRANAKRALGKAVADMNKYIAFLKRYIRNLKKQMSRVELLDMKWPCPDKIKLDLEALKECIQSVEEELQRAKNDRDLYLDGLNSIGAEFEQYLDNMRFYLGF